MAGKLDKMIAPDEWVVYRARYGFRDVLTNLLVISTGLVVFWLAPLLLFLRGDPNLGIYLEAGVVTVPVWIIVIGGHVTWRICTKSTVVTNRRLLYKIGVFRPKIHDIPLAEIERVGGAPIIFPFRNWRIRVWAGEIITFRSVPDGENVCKAIRAHCGLAQPSEVTTKVLVWGVYLMPAFAVTCGFLIFIAVRYGYDWAATYIPLLEISGLFLSLPITIGAGMIGVLVASAMALAILRIVLSADESKQLICIGYDTLSLDRRLDRLLHRHYRLAERYVSWLYGRPIRCGDDE